MHLSLFQLLIVAFGAVNATIEAQALQPLQPVTTGTVNKRADPTATVTLGPKSDYVYLMV